MVLEVRKIMLSKGELAMALNAYRRLYPEYLPGGKITRCSVICNTEIAIEMEIERAHTELVISKLSLKPVKLTEPMIHFCIDNRIMLPRRGKKSGIIAKGLPALFVELETFPVLEFESVEFES